MQIFLAIISLTTVIANKNRKYIIIYLLSTIDRIWSIENQDSFLKSSITDDDAYYDGDQQASSQIEYVQSIDCSIQCPPYWTEPVVQQKQTLVYPTSASVSFKCPYQAKPKAKLTWMKDGNVFIPELIELVNKWSSFNLYQFYSSLQLIICIWIYPKQQCMMLEHIHVLLKIV
jgi:hypothetical protein